MRFCAIRAFSLVTSLSFICVAADLHAAPEVHTKLGSLRGEYVSVKGKETGVHAFLGVPFAKPPLGPALRLVPPQPVEAWEGVRDATQQPPMCIQDQLFAVNLLGKTGRVFAAIPDSSEDCLYLSIYTPAKRAPGAKLPVMVWIHGGGFTKEGALMYDGSALAAYQDVVVVMIQYRLGLLGFLSTGDEHMPGNFGLLDQVEALKWVQQHIHSFGGNPDLVTIFGESAGGISVSLLLLSPLSDGLFHHAIAESGTAAVDVLLSNSPLPLTQMLANVSGCSLESTEKIADCMKNLDIHIIEAIAKNQQLVFPITVDGRFLTKPVDELFHKGELHAVPFINGVSDDEGGWLVPQFFGLLKNPERMNRDEVTHALSLLFPDPRFALAKDFIVDKYVGTGEDPVKNKEGFSQIMGDVLFNIPAIKTSNFHRDAGAAVYMYEYKYPPRFLEGKRPGLVGADHGDEVFQIFGSCFTTTYVTLANACPDDEEQFSKTMMSYWGNFARTGSPNGDGLAHWPRYDEDEKYLAIDLKEQVVGQDLKKDRFVFLTQTLPQKVWQHMEKMAHSEL